MLRSLNHLSTIKISCKACHPEQISKIKCSHIFILKKDIVLMNNYFSNRSFFSFSSSNNNSSFKIKTPGLQLRLPCPTYLKRRMNLVLRMLQVNQRIKTKLNKNYKKQNKVLNPPNRCNSIKIVLPLKKMLSPYPKSIIS